MLLYLSAAICWILRLRHVLGPDTLGCSGNGVMDACGECICNDHFFGNKCECEILQLGPQNMSAAIAECTPSAVPNTNVCSGRGECVCGRCQCNPVSDLQPDKKYSGKYCECGDMCPHYEGKLCGGNGWCDCGKCVCDKNYTGLACDCPTSVSNCLASNGQICNGKGSCICGKCECDTESPYQGPTCEDCTPEIIEYSSALCNNQGSLDSCGKCQCDTGHSGEFCECHNTSDDLCIGPFSTIVHVCSGRGDCICGMCSCFPIRGHPLRRYSGQYCQCDDYSCSYYDNMLCGGHGECICGECMCHEGYTGEACECPISTTTCIAENGRMCNGFGECQCGRCVCDRNSSFAGPLCEECPTCPGRCWNYKNCVLCRVFGTGSYTYEECQETCPPVDIVDYLDEGKIREPGGYFQ